MPIFSEIENILLEFGITAAAYHGGKPNGVDCRELLKLAKDIFECFKGCLLSVSNPGRCSEDLIVNACVTLDALTSKIRMKNSELLEEDYVVAEKHLRNLHYLWTQAKLSFTPKIHGLLSHAAPQMRYFQGIRDTLEDDVECIHQISLQIESHVFRMKNFTPNTHWEGSVIMPLQYTMLPSGVFPIGMDPYLVVLEAIVLVTITDLKKISSQQVSTSQGT
jgi:hypothetical protein